MPISRELLTAQAVAREPLRDTPGWTDAFSAGVARALEVLTDGGHLIPDPLEREQLEAMSDEEIHAHLTVHRHARYKAGSPDGPAAAVLLRRVIQRDQPEATMLVRDMDDDERYELTDAEDKTLAPATAAVAAALGSTRSTSPARSSPGATTLPTSTSPDRGRGAATAPPGALSTITPWPSTRTSSLPERWRANRARTPPAGRRRSPPASPARWRSSSTTSTSSPTR